MKKILMLGSSIFEQWTTAQNAFPEADVQNIAIGGTTTDYWVPLVAKILEEHQPDLFCYYCGSNDIGRGMDVNATFINTKNIYNIVHGKGIKFAFYHIIKAPEKSGKYEIIDEFNAKVGNLLSASDIQIDFNEFLFTNMDSGYYVEDRLHLTPKAYEEMERFNATECFFGV